jgi:hypothetical protein
MEERRRTDWQSSNSTVREKRDIIKPYDKPGNSVKVPSSSATTETTSAATSTNPFSNGMASSILAPLQSSSETFILNTNALPDDYFVKKLNESRPPLRESREMSTESFHSFVSEREALQPKSSSFVTAGSKLVPRLKLNPDEFESDCNALLDHFREEYNKGNVFEFYVVTWVQVGYIPIPLYIPSGEVGYIPIPLYIPSGVAS